MPEPGHRARFTQKPFGDVRVGGEFTPDNFDSYGSFEAQVGGTVNGSHASSSDFAFDTKPSGDKLGDIHNNLFRERRCMRACEEKSAHSCARV
jgi:hypothetical protein